MNIEDLWAEIEDEQSWREKELRFFINFMSEIESEEEKEQYRRAVVLMLYAHFEGFCIFALRHFVKAVNAAQLSCKDVQPVIAAATLSDVFSAMRDPSAKCDLFRNSLPDDTKLHRLASEKAFLENVDGINDRDVIIADEVIDAESNLKPKILSKNLYRLGLPHDLFVGIEGDINDLLGFRNKISHGEQRSGIDEDTFERLNKSALHVIKTVKREVMTALRNQNYLRVTN